MTTINNYDTAELEHIIKMGQQNAGFAILLVELELLFYNLHRWFESLSKVCSPTQSSEE